MAAMNPGVACDNVAIPLCKPTVPATAATRLGECFRNGWLGYGPVCHGLEHQFAAHHGGWALATSSCTSALYLAARICRRSERDEVIVPAITYVSTAMAFHAAGFKVRVADVDTERLMLTNESVLNCASEQTRAVVAVHLFGQKASLRALRELCQKRGWVLIEDCAHRLDLLDDEPPLGDLACYSFNALKEAPCGEGGLLWGRDTQPYTLASEISNLGLRIDTFARTRTLEHRDYPFGLQDGLKLRLNDVGAILVTSALDELVQTRARRREIGMRYDAALGGMDPAVSSISRKDDDSWLMYVVKVAPGLRERIRRHLAESAIASSVHYPSLARHPLFSGDACPNAERVAQQVLSLPSFLDLQVDQQERVARVLAEVAARPASHDI